eukprot:jgi/Galph1/1740/GphlegSOOS_G415.1
MDVWGENLLRPYKRTYFKESASSCRFRGLETRGRRLYCLCCHLNETKKNKTLFSWNIFLDLFFPLVPVISLGFTSKKWSQSNRLSGTNFLRYLLLLVQQLVCTTEKNPSKERKQKNPQQQATLERNPKSLEVLRHIEDYYLKQSQAQDKSDSSLACTRRKSKALSIHNQWLTEARILRYLEACKEPQKAAEKLLETWSWRCTLSNTANLVQKLNNYISYGDFRFLGQDREGHPTVYIHCSSDKFDLDFLSCVLETLDTYLDSRGIYDGSWIWILDWRKISSSKPLNVGSEQNKGGSFLDAVKICTRHYPGRLKKAFVIGAHGPLLTLFHMFAHRETKKKITFVQLDSCGPSPLGEYEDLMQLSHQTNEFNDALAKAGFLCSCSDLADLNNSMVHSSSMVWNRVRLISWRSVLFLVSVILTLFALIALVDCSTQLGTIL